MWVRSVGWEDPLEEEMVTISFPGKSHGQRSLAGYRPWGRRGRHARTASRSQQRVREVQVIRSETE